MKKLLIACEHATNKIPTKWQYLFEGADEILQSHRGWDPGAKTIFDSFSSLANQNYWYRWSRLLIEPNRSIHHPQLFSEITKILPTALRNELVDQYYLPYRETIEAAVRNLQQSGGKVYHISAHTFTPELHGQVRQTDIGLLYDPSSKIERDFASSWKAALRIALPEMRIRFNYPYKGTADGLTTYLRKQFKKGYAGIELEVNQRFIKDKPQFQSIIKGLSDSLQMAYLKRND